MDLAVSLLFLWQAVCAGNGKTLESTLIIVNVPLIWRLLCLKLLFGISITFPEHLGLDLIGNEVTPVKCKRWRYTASSSHNSGGSVRDEVKFPVSSCELFKPTEGAESKFPVIIAALKKIPPVSFCLF